MPIADYHQLINCLLAECNISLALKVVNFLASTSKVVDSSVYHKVMQACSDYGDIDNLERVMGHMNDANISYTDSTYSTLLLCLCRGGHINEAVNILLWYEYLI